MRGERRTCLPVVGVVLRAAPKSRRKEKINYNVQWKSEKGSIYQLRREEGEEQGEDENGTVVLL